MAGEEGLSEELVCEVFFNLDVKHVALDCALVCRRWHMCAGTNLLWNQLVKRDYPNIFLDEGEDVDSLLKRAEEEYAVDSLATGYCDWKKLYRYVACDRLCWYSIYETDVLRLSNENKTVTHTTDHNTHANMFTTTAFKKGLHKWNIKAEGLQSDYWEAIGVCIAPGTSWGYGTQDFIGVTSVGDSQAQSQGFPIQPRWATGGMFSLVLDCDKHTLDISYYIPETGNMGKMDTLYIPALVPEMRPWVNIYERGASATLLPYKDVLRDASSPQLYTTPS